MSTDNKIFLFDHLIWCDDIYSIRTQHLNEGYTEVYTMNADNVGIFACEKDGAQKIFVRAGSQLPILHLNTA